MNEPFDPDTFYASKQKTPKEIREYLEVRFRKCIEKDHRKRMARDCPLPDTPAAHPPEPDGDIVDYLGKDFPHNSDKQLRRIQATILATSAPLTHLWSELVDQKLTAGSNGLVPVEVVLETIQCSLVLIGNASHYVSQARRAGIIDKLDEKARGLRPTLGRLCKEDLGNTGKYLFGPQFRKALTDKAEAISSFARVAQKVSNPQSTGQAKKFLRPGPTPVYGGGLGRANHQPYNPQQQRPNTSFQHKPRPVFRRHNPSAYQRNAKQPNKQK